MEALTDEAAATPAEVVGSSEPARIALSCAEHSVREVNAILRSLPAGTVATVGDVRGLHNLAVGVNAPITVDLDGNCGYFVGGLSAHADITVRGFAGWSVGENLMSGSVRVLGDVSECAAASAHGGRVVIDGNASSRLGISLKGGTVMVAGDAGHASAFMAQAGTIVIGGDAGAGLGDSLYEAVIYVGGTVASLGADARYDELTDADVALLTGLFAEAGFDHLDPGSMTKISSARTLYNFDALKHQRY